MFTPAPNKLAGLTVDTAHELATALLERRRALHGSARMDATDGGGTGGTDTGGTDGGTGGTDAGTGTGTPAATFTQADVDRLITSRLERERAARDKAVADANRTADQRLADLERELASTRLSATRATVAARHNLGDLADVLAGDTEEALEANAKRLADRLKGATTSTSSTTSTRTRSVKPTVREQANPAKDGDRKAAAIEALRGLGGNRGRADD